MNLLRMITLGGIALLGLSVTVLAETQAGDLLGSWQFVEGYYDGEFLSSSALSATLHIIDEIHYQAEFDNGSDSGFVDGQFTLEDDVFNANADDEYVVRNGEKRGIFCCPVRRLWKTIMNCSDATYDQWGGTALGFGDPVVSVDGDQLLLESADGLTYLTYEKVVGMKFHVDHISVQQVIVYGQTDDPVYEMQVDILTDEQVLAIDCNSPGTEQWTLTQTPWSSDGVQTDYRYDEQEGLYHWSYVGQFEDVNGLVRYNDALDPSYRFTIHLADETTETTRVGFQSADGHALDLVLQEPKLIYPQSGSQAVPTSVTFVYEAPLDPNWTATLSWDDLDSVTLPATESTYGPVTLNPGDVYQLGLSVNQSLAAHNEDGVSYVVSTAATKTFMFSTKVFLIPDEALYTKLQILLGVDEITSADLLSITHLELAESGIMDLTGLEGAVNLEYLDLTGNEISDLSSLSELTSLQALGLKGNVVVDVTPLAGLTALEELFLDDNQIENVASLHALGHLKRVNLRNNAIVEVTGLQSLAALEVLWLNDNAIVDIGPLTQLKGLMYLDVRGNPLTDSACQDLAELQVTVEGNQGWLRADIEPCAD